MRIALVNDQLLPVLNVGLASIIATLRQEGHEVQLVDLMFIPRREAYRRAIDELRIICPDIIGISTGHEYESVVDFIRMIRCEVGSQPILVGGMVPSYFKCGLKDIHARNLENIWTFAGQSNGTIIRFLRDYEQGHLPNESHIAPPNEDLNALLPVPDYRLFDMPRYFKESLVGLGYLPIYASQGCPFSCSFCGCKDRSYVHKQPERVREEVLIQESRHKKHGMRWIHFSDPTFGFHKKNFEKMMRFFRQDNLRKRIPWMCQTRPEVITNDWARKAARSGCFMVSLGLECGSEAVRRDILNKKFTNAQFCQAIANLKEAGIWYVFTVMGGIPGTSFKTDVESIMFATSFAPAAVLISAYYPAEGTSLGDCMFAGKGFPSVSLRANAKAYTQSLISLFPLFKQGFAYHKHDYLKEVLGVLFNVGGRRSFKLSHLRTYPILGHRILHRPMFDLLVDKYVEEQPLGGKENL